ncbi:MAG TPA: hypothetical protein VFO49_08780 [Nocardioides sp.]|nr:hypothetical protein [Nocardioides sp.]
MPSPDASDYRLAPLLIARFVGLYLVLLAVVVFAATIVVAASDLPGDALVVLLVLGLAGLFVLAWVLRSKITVVHLDATGYTVAMIRGAGVKEARWADVEDAVTASPRGFPSVVIRLRDGGSTTIPVQALAGDPDDLARDVRDRLRAGGRRGR